MRNHQSGFTLIELMIVVAIVGILASVAVPAYSDYTVRAKVSEAVAAVAPVKASVADYYYGNGELPRSSANAGLDTDESGTDPVLGGGYATDVIGAITVDQAPSAGTIKVTFKDLDGGTTADTTLVFIPTIGDNGQITWMCEADNGNGTLPARFAPASCRG